MEVSRNFLLLKQNIFYSLSLKFKNKFWWKKCSKTLLVLVTKSIFLACVFCFLSKELKKSKNVPKTAIYWPDYISSACQNLYIVWQKSQNSLLLENRNLREIYKTLSYRTLLYWSLTIHMIKNQKSWFWLNFFNKTHLLTFIF